MSYNHVCSLGESASDTRIFKALWKITEISRKNPNTRRYFRSIPSIENERTRVKSLHYYFIIHPLSIFRFYWDAMAFLCFYVSLYVIPLNIAFSGCVNVHIYRITFAQKLYYVELLFDIIHLMDTALTFLTGQYNHNNFIFNPKEIARMYLTRLQFYGDLICSIPIQPLIVIYASFNTDWQLYSTVQKVKLTSLLKVVRLYKTYIYFYRTTEFLRTHHYSRIFTIFFLVMMVILHWITCMNLLASQTILQENLREEVLFLDHRKAMFGTCFEVYCYVLYISIARMLNINIEESNVASFSSGLGSTYYMFSLMINGLIGFVGKSTILVLLVGIIMSKNSSQIKYQCIRSQLSKYMQYKDLPKNMRDRIVFYYEYRFQRKYFRENAICEMLSDSLRKEINLYNCRTLIENVTLLKDLPAEIIGEVVSNLKLEVYLYNDFIVKAGTIGDCMYFILNGTVAVSTATGKEICHLQDGAYFGEIALISKDKHRVANVVAIEICEIYRLDQKSFKNCFPANSPYYKRIEQVAMERMQKTVLLEELHKKFIVEKTLQRNAEKQLTTVYE